MTAHDDAILAEHALAETKVLLERTPTPATTHLGFFETLTRLRDTARCATCGKTTLVFNAGAGRRGFKAEHVTLASHCACTPDSPAYHLLTAGSGGDSTE